MYDVILCPFNVKMPLEDKPVLFVPEKILVWYKTGTSRNKKNANITNKGLDLALHLFEYKEILIYIHGLPTLTKCDYKFIALIHTCHDKKDQTKKKKRRIINYHQTVCIKNCHDI